MGHILNCSFNGANFRCYTQHHCIISVHFLPVIVIIKLLTFKKPLAILAFIGVETKIKKKAKGKRGHVQGWEREANFECQSCKWVPHRWLALPFLLHPFLLLYLLRSWLCGCNDLSNFPVSSYWLVCRHTEWRFLKYLTLLDNMHGSFFFSSLYMSHCEMWDLEIICPWSNLPE